MGIWTKFIHYFYYNEIFFVLQEYFNGFFTSGVENSLRFLYNINKNHTLALYFAKKKRSCAKTRTEAFLFYEIPNRRFAFSAVMRTASSTSIPFTAAMASAVWII